MTRVIEAFKSLLWERLAPAGGDVVHSDMVHAAAPTPAESAAVLKDLADRIENGTDAITVQRITITPRATGKPAVVYQSLTVWFSTEA